MKILTILLLVLVFSDKIYVKCIDNQSKTNNEAKKCLFRNLPPQSAEVWIQLTCGFCYNYANDMWFNKKLPIATQEFQGNWYLYTKVDGKIIDFDYNKPDNMKIVRESFKENIYFEKFVDCCHQAEDCCQNSMTNENIIPNDEYPCPYIWDAWSCFPPAKRGTISHLTCPPYTSSSTTAECLLSSNKECFQNGTWNQNTDYAVCSTASIYRRRHNFHLYVLYVATAFMLPSIIIFCLLKKLHILRLMLHFNLIICIVMKNLTIILSKNIVILDALKTPSESNNILEDSGVPCKVLAVIDNIFKNAIFTGMFADGFYLHKMIARPLDSDPNIYILIGIIIVCSVVPSLIWMILMVTNSKENCWMVDSDSWFQWVTDGYKYVILGINTILLLHIFYILVCKLQLRNSTNTKSAIKAAILLVPLFGVPLIITSQREIFDQNDCTAGDIYYYVTYAVEGLQGILVALFFCYLNVEVKKQLEVVYKKLQNQIRNKVENNNIAARRRTTATTNVRSSVSVIYGKDGFRQSYRTNVLKNNEAFN